MADGGENGGPILIRCSSQIRFKIAEPFLELDTETSAPLDVHQTKPFYFFNTLQEGRC